MSLGFLKPSFLIPHLVLRFLGGARPGFVGADRLIFSALAIFGGCVVAARLVTVLLVALLLGLLSLLLFLLFLVSVFLGGAVLAGLV